MELFEFSRAATPPEAIAAGAKSQTAQQGANVRFLAGGTTLYDLMKLDVERPQSVVDINRLPLGRVEKTEGGGLCIGALARNAVVAHHPEVLKHYPVLSQAILQGASGQIRNMASTAGNLLRRTRCVYFRDVTMPCNKRAPGSDCSAIDGFNRNLAILGTSDGCIASNASDMNVALMALGATVHIQGTRGERAVHILHRDIGALRLPRLSRHSFFQDRCNTCHAANLKGKPGFSPSITASDTLGKYDSKTWARLMDVGLTDSGRHVKAPIPVYHMKAQDSEALYAYLKTVK